MSRLLSEEIQREVLRLKDTETNRAIGRMLGISRLTVAVIKKRGYVKHNKPKSKQTNIEISDKLVYRSTGETGRCPICGAKVALPCLECIIREWKKKHPTTVNAM